MQLKRQFEYRIDFALRSLFGPVVEILAVIVLWSSVFNSRAVNEIGGFSLNGMIFYYIVATFLNRFIKGSYDTGVAEDIYQGTLSKFLIYPSSFFSYKFGSYLGTSFMCLPLLGIGTIIIILCLGAPVELQISALSIAQGLIASLLASCLIFNLLTTIEMIAFWAGSIHNLVHMFHFIINLLGGLLLPLSLFPESLQLILSYSPFRYTVSFPTECFIGKISITEYAAGLLVGSIWCLVFAQLRRGLWLKGLRQYTGSGI